MKSSPHRNCASCDSGRTLRLVLITAATVMPILFAIGCAPPPVPTDAQDACPLSPATFASWFESGSVSLNGVVNPANSLINLAPNCGFYEWSEQMFMWLTSPAPPAYGGGAHIFDSPAFFDVSPPDASGNRTFLAHTPGFIHAFPLRAAQRGPHQLPVVIDLSGELLEFNPPDPKLKALVRAPSGQLVEIAHARLENGRPILLDSEGKVIQVQHTPRSTRATTVAPPAGQKRMKNAPIGREWLAGLLRDHGERRLCLLSYRGQGRRDYDRNAQPIPDSSVGFGPDHCLRHGARETESPIP